MTCEEVWSTKTEVTSSDTFSKSDSGQIRPRLGFRSDFGDFLKILDFAALVVAGTPQAPPLDSKWLPGVFAKYLELFRVHAPAAALENRKLFQKIGCDTLHSK